MAGFSQEDRDLRIQRADKAIWRRDGFEAADNSTPLDSLMMIEEHDPSLDSVSQFAEREEMLRFLNLELDFLFADGPHPADVLRRAFSLARALCPERIGHWPMREARMLGEDHRSRVWRLGLIFRGYPGGGQVVIKVAGRSFAPEDFLPRVEFVLGVVARQRAFETPEGGVALSDLLAAGEGLDSAKLKRFGTYFFKEAGEHPGRVIRRIYATAWGWRRSLIGGMSQTELGAFFGERKATPSARIKEMFNRPMKALGMLGFKLPGQKPEAACVSYSNVQKGNQNRLGRPSLLTKSITVN